MTILRLEGIEKRILRKEILQDISIQIKKRSFTVILGPMGAGKTTLFKIIAGCIKPNKGRIYLRGEDVTDLPPQKRKVAMVFQTFNLYPNLTVYENIASPLRAVHKSNHEIKKKVLTQAEILGISSLLYKHVYELSGGEGQRVLIARALVKEADIYLFDEPLANLDYKLREGMAREMKNILSAEGFEGTILYATPNYEEALSMSTTNSNTILLQSGRIIWSGPTLFSYLTPPCIAFAENFPSPPMNFFESRLIEEKDDVYLFANDEIKLKVTHLKGVFQENEYILGLYPYSLHIEKKDEKMIPIIFNLILVEVNPSGTTLHLEYDGKKVTGFLPHPQDLKGKQLKLFIYPHDFFIFSKKTGELIMKYRSINNGKN